MGVRTAAGFALLALVLPLSGSAAEDGAAEARFRAANEQVRAGDYPKALAGYAELARAGQESASLYWNWAQAATARGAAAEALWALLRAREIDPADRAVLRDVERLREALNLDAAEIAPEPLASVARLSRRYRLDLLAGVLLLASLALHGWARLRGAPGGLVPAGVALALGLLAAAGPIAGSFARPTAVVVQRGAPLFDAASADAEPTGTLREGEVVPLLDGSGGEWLRVEDNAGARGWARARDLWRLDRPPAR